MASSAKDIQLRELKDTITQLMFFVKHFSLKKASEFPEISKGISLKKAGHIESPLHVVYPLVETNLFKGGKEDVHYVPNQSYQRFE